MRKLIILALSLVSMGSLGAQAADLKYSVSGSSVAHMEADFDLDGSAGFLSNLAGKSNFGKLTVVSTGDLAPWDQSSFCNINPDTGFPGSINLTFLASNHVLRMDKGDLLYLSLSNSPPSTFCFNFIYKVSNTFEVYLYATGGSGRFNNASGTVLCQGESLTIGPGHNAVSYDCDGSLELENGHHGKSKKSAKKK
jgi:hypothetical protein